VMGNLTEGVECQPRGCTRMPVQLGMDSSMCGVLASGETCEVECLPGYQHIGNSQSVTCELGRFAIVPQCAPVGMISSTRRAVKSAVRITVVGQDITIWDGNPQVLSAVRLALADVIDCPLEDVVADSVYIAESRRLQQGTEEEQEMQEVAGDEADAALRRLTTSAYVVRFHVFGDLSQRYRAETLLEEYSQGSLFTQSFRAALARGLQATGIYLAEQDLDAVFTAPTVGDVEMVMPAPVPEEENATGAIVGIVLALVIGGVLLAIFFRRYLRRRRSKTVIGLEVDAGDDLAGEESDFSLEDSPKAGGGVGLLEERGGKAAESPTAASEEKKPAVKDSERGPQLGVPDDDAPIRE